jgi:hypothetical protein
MKRRLIRISIILLLLALPWVAWRMYLSHYINQRLAEIQTEGLPTNGEELNRWYAAVPDKQNAALALTHVFNLRRHYPDNRSNLVSHFKLPRCGEPLSAEQAELLEGYVAMNSAMFPEADKALELPASRYPVDCTRLMNTPLPHLARLKNLAELYQYAAFLAMRSGRPDRASSNIVTMLALARTLDNEPCLISQLVRLQVIGMAFATLERRANTSALSADEVTNLTAAFASARTTDLATRALIGERAMTIPYFRMTRAEATRFNPRKDSDETRNDSPLPYNGPAILKLIGYYDLDFGSYLAGMSKGIEMARRTPPANLAANRYFAYAGDESAKRHRAISGRLLSAYSVFVSRGNEAVAWQRLALTALAVERFTNRNGRRPETLEELTSQFRVEESWDPFSGKALQYRRTETGYILYSVGQDGRDDGGLELVDKRKSADGKSYDLPFTVER